MTVKTATKLPRYNLELTPAARENLNRLQERTQSTTYTEVFRKALSLYDFITEHQAAGDTILIRTKNGQEQIVRLL